MCMASSHRDSVLKAFLNGCEAMDTMRGNRGHDEGKPYSFHRYSLFCKCPSLMPRLCLIIRNRIARSIGVPEHLDADMHKIDATEHPDDDQGIEIVDLD